MDKPTTQPLTRNQEEVLEALRITDAELGFHVHRLRERVNPDTQSEQERAHLADMADVYERSRKGVQVLIRYQEGRLAGNRSRTTSGIDLRGRATANVHDEE